jgi:predicted Zn-dependent peptidase
VGGFVSVGLSSDYFEFSLSIPTEHLNSVLTELRSQILSVNINQEVFDREKDLTQRELEAEKDDPNALAYQGFMEATYPNHPYSLRSEGKSEIVEKLTLKDIQSYYEKNFVAADMIAVLAGNFSSDQEEQIQKIFMEVPIGEPVILPIGGDDIKSNSNTSEKDPRIQQAKLYLAYSAPAATSPDYIYAKILSEILGGGMSSPYFSALRKEKGYAYSVGVIYPSRLKASRFTGYIGLQEENADDAISTMQALNKSIFQNVTDVELEKTKNHILGQLLYEAETNGRRAWYAAFFENLELGFDHLEKYVEHIKQVKKEDLAKVAYIFDKPYTVFMYKGGD